MDRIHAIGNKFVYMEELLQVQDLDTLAQQMYPNIPTVPKNTK